MAVALTILHAWARTATPIVYSALKRHYVPASQLAPTVYGPAIHPSTMTALERRGYVVVRRARLGARAVTQAKLTADGAWRARTLERMAREKVSEIGKRLREEGR